MVLTQYFRRNEASAYLKNHFAIQASISYLAKLAVVGGGPAFHKAGRWPIYSREAMARLGKLVASTAEYGRVV
jgi:hypothetical protein